MGLCLSRLGPELSYPLFRRVGFYLAGILGDFGEDKASMRLEGFAENMFAL